MKFTLYAHQNTELEHLASNRSFALFAEQGTGKTLPTLLHILNLLKDGQIVDALIICPKAVMDSWYRDMDKFSPMYKALLRRKITVINYDLVWRRAEFMRSWGCVVLDESHFIKHRTSRRAKFILKLGTLANYRYILTGTPIGNSHWDEIWAPYNFLDPSIFGKYSEFEKRYCILNQFYKPYRYINTAELKEKIFAHAYRVTKIECLDLPEKLLPERYSLDIEEKKLYKEMLKNYIEELNIEAKNPLARMTKLRQMCSGFINDADGTLHKLKCGKAAALADFLDNWDSKLVIFAEYKQSARDIAAVLIKLKIKYVTLDGEQKDKGIWKQFQSDSTIQVIVCQYKSASAGIDLFAADTIIFYEPTLSSQTFEQSCDRIHRLGQTNRCSYILFETKGTIEQKMWNALAEHRNFDEHELWAFVKEVK
jgi:SNF2 family DNA or RNA helicase